MRNLRAGREGDMCNGYYITLHAVGGLLDLRFSRLYCWRFRSSGMFCDVDWYVFNDI